MGSERIEDDEGARSEAPWQEPVHWSDSRRPQREARAEAGPVREGTREVGARVRDQFSAPAEPAAAGVDAERDHLRYGATFDPARDRLRTGDRGHSGVIDELHRARIAGTQRGVGAAAGRGPKGYRRSDAGIREDVCQVLTDDHDVDASEIEVEVADAEVTLRGTVEDRNQKRWAEDAVERVRGVVDVHNQLRVRHGMVDRAVDKVKSALGVGEPHTPPRGG